MLMEVSLDAVLVRAGPHIAHRSLRRFLHHFPELSGERELSAAGHQSGFSRKNLAANFCPGKTRNKSDFVRLILPGSAVLRNADVIADVLGAKLNGFVSFALDH